MTGYLSIALSGLVFSTTVLAQSLSPGKSMVEDWLKHEMDAEFRTSYLAERKELERKYSSTSDEDVSPQSLSLLFQLGRSYLGTPLLSYGRDEEKVKEVLTRMRAGYPANEFSLLLLQFESTAPALEDEKFDIPRLEARIEACYSILALPPGHIVDSTKDLSEKRNRDILAETVRGLRAGARDRLMQSVLSRGLDDPFTLEQLKLVQRRMADDYELDSWAKGKIYEYVVGPDPALLESLNFSSELEELLTDRGEEE